MSPCNQNHTCSQEVPTQIGEALSKHLEYQLGGKADRALLAQAISILVRYLANETNHFHMRQFVLCVEKPLGGDRTQASLGSLALTLETTRFPSVEKALVDLIEDGWRKV